MCHVILTCILRDNLQRPGRMFSSVKEFSIVIIIAVKVDYPD